MNVIPTSLKEVLIVEPAVYADKRGFFMETYHQERYRKAGISQSFIQDNLSFSVKGTLRGLHFQINQPQAKLVQVISGEIFDVAVDIRKGSPTFGQWAGVHLSSETRRQLFVPEGFAHGFCVLSETALFLYKCSDLYVQADEGGVLWSDPDIGINWPIKDPIISDKDNLFPCLSLLLPHQLPRR